MSWRNMRGKRKKTASAMPTVPLGIGVKCDVILAGKFGGNK
jgi:hypothetical protein